MASATGIAYALIVLLGVLILVTVLQLVQAAHVLRRQRAGQPTAPKRSLVLLATAIVSLVLSYIFDVSVTALRLVQGSQTPPPSGAHLALVVITTFLGQGLAPAAIYAAAESIINNRVDVTGLQNKDVSSVKRRKFSQLLELVLLVAFPMIMIAFLGVFAKAVLDTPTLASKYYSWLNTANTLYRAAVVVHALLFRGLASRAISVHLLSKSHSIRDPILRMTILYHLTPSMFARTVALFVFTPLASNYSTAKTPASATAILFAFDFFVGFATVLAVQSLLSGAMRPAAEWAPAKTAGEQEVENGDVPGDNAATDAPGKKRARADSIALSPTRATFGGGIRAQEETSTSN